MHRSSIVPLLLGLAATVAHGQQSARIIRYPRKRHRCRACESTLHNAYRASFNRKDSGSSDRRQGLLDHRCSGQLLLPASGEGRHSFEFESHHR